MAGASRPVLLVEGHGDKAAVPELLRRVAADSDLGVLLPASHPIMCGDIPKLQRSGSLERFVEYACRRDDGDCVLLTVDSDDDCPKEVSARFSERIEPIARQFEKKVGIVFFYREFETLFLLSFTSIAERFGLPRALEVLSLGENLAERRGAKEALSAALRRERRATIYKETRDQVRFSTALDFACLREASRAFRHLESTLRWLVEDGPAEHWTCPRAGTSI